MLMHERLDWAKYFLSIAIAARARADCQGSHYGAVLVKDKHPIAMGYNGTPTGSTNCTEGGCYRCGHLDEFRSGEGYDRCICVHAELNCILTAARFGFATEGTTLYATARPCLSCAKELLQAGVSGIFYIYEWTPSENLRAEYEAFYRNFATVRKIDMEDPEMDKHTRLVRG